MEKAVVIGRNYCNILTTARALGSAGYEVEVVKVFKEKPNAMKFLRTMKPDAKSKYVSSYRELVVGSDENAIADCLLEFAEGTKKLLVPVDDYVCCAVDRSLDELSKYFFAPCVNGTGGEIIRLMDKNEQKMQAEKYKLPLLQSCLIKSENGKFSIPDDVHYPCFIKPNVSMKSTKDAMRKCENQNELSKVLAAYAGNGDFEMLAEEYAQIKNEYSLLGFSTGNRAITSGVFRVVEGGHHDRKGVALMGETVNPDGFDEIIEKCSRFVEGIGYIGMFDIDLIENTDGKMYFVEINFRAGASTYALNELGVNLYGMYADYIMKGKPADENARVKESKLFISEKVLMEEFARGDISASQVRRYMNSADIFFVKSKDDMKPYEYFRKFYFLSALVRILYKVKG